MSFDSTVQSQNPGAQIFLFRLDLTPVGGNVIFFTQAANPDAGVRFGGQYYTPVDVEFSDYEMNGQGSLPTPKFRMSNTNEVIQGVVNAYGEDLIGCKLQRVRTFARFLDGGVEADPGAYYGPDTFEIEQKTAETPLYIEWKLSAAIDQQGRMIPGRQALRDACTARYRVWRGASNGFDYTKATCPYTGAQAYNRDEEQVGASKDVCGRRLESCERRFGKNKALPFWGFPGMARVRR